MKAFKAISFSIMLLLLVGCEYEAPLVAESKIAIDPAVLGLWEASPAEGEAADPDERMLILKYSDTEYLIHYPPRGNDELYYRAYPVKVGGMSCIQIQVIGTNEGPLEKDAKALFHVASYQLKDGKLEIKLLNTDLVGKDLKTTAELKQAFLKNKDSKDLFKDPGMFRRVDL